MREKKRGLHAPPSRRKARGMKLAEGVVSFLKRQSYVIFSTVDGEGRPHSVAKGIVDVDEGGVICLLDLYRGKTYDNLRGNARASLTAIDEREFAGYTVKGRARVVEGGSLDAAVRQKWRKLIRGRISKRIARNIQSEIGGTSPHEALMPAPEYIIVFEAEELIDLAHRGRGGPGE